MKRAFLALAFVLFWASFAVAQTDAIPPNTITFVGGPSDIGAWPITTTITRIDLRLNGVSVEFDKRDGPNRWPDTCAPSPCVESPAINMGALQYSLGVALKVNGTWFASAPIETWFGNNTIGGQLQAQGIVGAKGQIAANWFYDGRWGPLAGYQPAPGEAIGVFVVAGDARNSFNPRKERSNIVVLALPPSNTPFSFDFPLSTPLPPIDNPTPPIDNPTPPVDLGVILSRLTALETAVQVLDQRSGADETVVNSAIAVLEPRLRALESRPVPMSCSASVFGVPIHCAIK